MPPHRTGRQGRLCVPGPTLSSLTIRYAPLPARDDFAPDMWPQHAFVGSTAFPGWWEFDLDALTLADGTYEYEFVANGTTVVADPYADTLTRFGGYRGLLTISNGARIARPFDWRGEFSAGVALPRNNQIVIYEMPIKGMASDPGEGAPLAELGTFDKVIFEHLDDLAAMGIKCIELLPIEDSPQTLNWGYGTRFFFAPDYDIGTPVDAKLLVKACHRRGIRVVLDVVMNMYAPPCPLGDLAAPWFNTPSTPQRKDWGQELFLFDTPAAGGYYAAREFLCEMGEFWVSEYHIDGYRIDDFADINNWDFVQEFHDRTTAMSANLFPGKPFVVIAEDSSDRFGSTADDPNNPNGRKVVDALWNFGYMNEIRRLLTDSIDTSFGQPARSVRVAHLISNQGAWDAYTSQFQPGFADMSCAVPYITSHDVNQAPRLMNVILGPMLQAAGLAPANDLIGLIAAVRNAVDTAANSDSSPVVKQAVAQALTQVFGGFAILMTSVGMPMFLAGEEFGDVHDTDYNGVNPKQQDPVQWQRAQFQGNAALKAAVAALIKLRVTHPALQRDEVQCFYFHPNFDDDHSPRVLAYCRTANLPLGSPGQVVVVANMGPQSYVAYNIPNWPWAGGAQSEVGYPDTAPTGVAGSAELSLSLNSFAARVFTT